MPVYLTTALMYACAVLAEIAGCFAFWAWLRLGQSILWVAPDIVALIAFAYLLTPAPTDNAGRPYADYGDVYIVASWLWL